MAAGSIPRRWSRPRSPAAKEQATAGGGYRVGQQVEIEASKHWVPCVVSEISGAPDPLIRVRCAACPALSRAAGTYIVHDSRNGIRPATGRTGPAPARPTPARVGAGPGSVLRVGEYACYGAGMRIMAGLKFTITGAGSYTDAYGRAGTYSIGGTIVTFRGGALGDMSGRDLKADNSFTLSGEASCQLWR